MVFFIYSNPLASIHVEINLFMASKIGKEIFRVEKKNENSDSDSESTSSDEEEEEETSLGKRESSTVLTPVKSNRKKVKASLSGKKSVTYNLEEDKEESLSCHESRHRTPKSSSNKDIEVY